MRSNGTVYSYAERPGVEVLVEGEWLVGEARMRWQDDETGAWVYNVAWRSEGTHTRKLDNFPADRVRPAVPSGIGGRQVSES